MPQTSRPSASRQVPKFSMCRSPTASALGFGQIRTKLGPDLYPAIKGRAKKRKCSFGHVLVLGPQIRFNNSRAPAQPFLEPPGCFDDVHAGWCVTIVRA